MINKKIKLLIVALLPLLIAAADFTDYTTLINQKMETEQRLQDHVGSIVERMVGEGKSSVIISIETTDLRKSQVVTEQWLESEQEAEAAPQREEYLPGVPLRDTMQESAAPEQEPGRSGGKRVEDIITLPSEFIQSIRVSMLIDESVPDDLVARVDDVVNDVLAIDPARGDRVSIQRVNFAGRSIDLAGFLFNPYFYIVALVLITLAILGFFLFGPLKKFLFATLQTLKDLKGMKSETEYTGAGGGGGGGGGVYGAGLGEGEMEIEEEIEEEGEEELPVGEEVEGEGEEPEEEEYEKMTYKPLKFLEDKDYKKLAYLLNFENPNIAALIINYLDAPKAAKVMAALPVDKKNQVAKSIVRFQRSSKEIMEHIDDFLSKKIDYVTGGVEKLVGVIELMSEEERGQLLDNLAEEDPEFAEKVKSRIFSFDDITNLDDAALQMVIQSVETQDLGMALKNASDELKEKFMENMSEGAAALLKEEIEFGKKLTGGQIKNKQQEIVAKIKELESDGTISGVTSAGTPELMEEELGEEDKEAVLEGIIEAARHALDKNVEEEASASAGGNDDEAAFKFYEQGLQAYKNEDYSGAIEKFTESLKYNPDIWQTHQYLGSCYLALGNEAKAKDEYSQSLSLNPDNAELAEWVKSH